MEILKAIILGIVQGLTEFLPVSSSGHLVILGEILGRELGGEGSTAQSVLLHLGSWLAILIVFRKDILKLVWPRFDFRAFAMLFIASLPAAIVGLTIKKLLPDAQEQWIEANVLQSPWVACCGLIATALVLWLAERKRQLFVRFETAKGVHFWLVGVVGIAQMIAILPGISRSGSTICMALMLRWVKSDAVKLSFLMGLIAIGGAGLVEAKEISHIDPAPAIAGFLASLVFSLIGLAGIKLVVEKEKLKWFGVYTAIAGVAALIYFVLYPPVGPA
ncbi:MAG: undecaprenyl-diphosphate phosphatase [Planctomycetes bacterium]|nr:undecaprenyl-diphosphate phosphatase [Planctomycetota bacterium]